jgi:hypothetical protein
MWTRTSSFLVVFFYLSNLDGTRNWGAATSFITKIFICQYTTINLDALYNMAKHNSGSYHEFSYCNHSSREKKKRNGEKELAYIAYVIASSISLLYSFIH